MDRRRQRRQQGAVVGTPGSGGPTRRIRKPADRIGRNVSRGGKGISLAYTDFGNSSGGGGRADRPGRSGGGGGGGSSPSYSTPNAILNSPGATPSASYPSAPSSPSTPIATAGPATAPAAAPRPAAPVLPGTTPARSPSAAIRQGTVAGGEYLQRIVDAGTSKRQPQGMEATINAIMQGKGEQPATGPIPTTVPPSNNTQEVGRTLARPTAQNNRVTQALSNQRAKAKPKPDMMTIRVPEGVPDPYKKAVAQFSPMVDDVAQQHGYKDEAEYLAKILQFESAGWQPNAVGPDIPGGAARGLGQFIPSTRDDFVNRLGVDPWKNPRSSIKASAMHLSGDYGYSPGYEGYNPGYGNYDEPLQQDVGRMVKVKVPAKGPITSQREPSGPKPKALAKWIVPNESRDEIASELGVKPGKADIITKKLDPNFQRALVKLGRASGDPLSLTEGFRTRYRQEQLANGTGGATGVAAAPGTSRHEEGDAVDVTLTPEQEGLLAKFGLSNQVVAGEPWHVQFADDADYGGSGSMRGPALVGGSTGSVGTTTTSTSYAAPAQSSGGSSYAPPATVPMGTSARPTTRPSGGTGSGYTSPIAARPVMPGGGSTTNSALASALGGQQRSSSRSDRDLEKLLASLSDEELEELGLA